MQKDKKAADVKKKLVVNQRTIDELRKAAEVGGPQAEYPGTFSNCSPSSL